MAHDNRFILESQKNAQHFIPKIVIAHWCLVDAIPTMCHHSSVLNNEYICEAMHIFNGNEYCGQDKDEIIGTLWTSWIDDVRECNGS